MNKAVVFSVELVINMQKNTKIRVKTGLKKFGVTALFGVFGVFRFILNPRAQPWVTPSTTYQEDSYWDELTLRYQQAIEELDVQSCIDYGNTEQACRVSAIAA
jgi:hypothetical protein